MSQIALANGEHLSEEDIHHIVREEVRALRNDDYSDDLKTNHREAYKYYRVDPRGDEQEGRSKVQSTDVSDAIEWILPVIVKAFIESPDAVRFDPLHPEDEEQANLETDYTHHVFMKECQGFLVVYEFIKDALLLKNGVSYCYWNEEVKQTPEEFSDLLEPELNFLLNPTDGSEIRIEEQTKEVRPVIDPQTHRNLLDPETGEPLTAVYYSGRYRRYESRGRAAVEVCVPENFRIRSDHPSVSLQDTRFCYYRMEKAASDLVAAGYDVETIDTCPGVDQSREQWDEVRQAREDVERNRTSYARPYAIEMADRSQRMISVFRCYVRLDTNGDGHEEQYVVVLGGDEGEVIFDYYEVDHCPFDAASPFVAAHKFWGYSVYDKLKQLQDLKTKFLRMISDNGDFINNPEKKINPGLMRAEDALVKRVGGLKRVDDPAAYEELPPGQIGPLAFQILEWADKMRGERVGVDPDAASVSKIFPEESMNTAVERLLAAKEEVVNMMIRLIGELWFGPLMLKLRGIVMSNMNRETLVSLRNRWVRVDPRSWQERTGSTVKIGLGTGDRIKTMQGIQTVIAFQGQEMQLGAAGVTVTPSKRVAAYNEFIRAAGLGETDEFFLDPVKTEAEIMQMGGDPRRAPSAEVFEAFVERQKQAAAAQAAQQPAQGPTGPDPQTLLRIEQMKGQTAKEVKAMELQARQETEQYSAQMNALMKRMDLMVEQQQFMAENTRKWAELFEEAGVSANELVIKAAEARAKAKTVNQGNGEDNT